MSTTRFNSRMDTSEHGLSHLSLGGCERHGRLKKCGEVSLHFELVLNALGVLSVPTDKTPKD
jgi:hypothetical protein